MSGGMRGKSFGPNIKKEDIEKGQLIAKGEYGTVWKGKCRSIDVAIKLPLKQRWDKKSILAFRKEVQIMSEIFHPNVCLFMGACLESGNISIVSELMSGSLTKLLKSKKDFPLSTRLDWARQAAEGMNWLHGNNPPVIHLDLKPDNLLYDESMNIKVCDFGLSRFMEDGQERLMQPVGTPLYMSPEVMEIRKRVPTEVTNKVDVYSFGIIIWEILTRKDAFANHKNYLLFSRAVRAGERPPIPSSCPSGLKHLMNRCWARDPATRPEFREIVAELAVLIEAEKKKEQEERVKKLVADAYGRSYWLQHFGDTQVLEWQDFAEPLLPFLQKLYVQRVNEVCGEQEAMLVAQEPVESSFTPVLCLKAVLADDGMVSMRAFGKILGYFGPFWNAKDGGNGFLDRVCSVLSWTAFHGFISSTIAAQILESEPKGVYLLRVSQNSPHSFCLSKSLGGRRVQHLVLPYEPTTSKFCLDGREYESLQQLVTLEADHFGLLYSSPCERYLYLFDGNVAPSSGYQQLDVSDSDEEAYFM